MSTWNKKNFSIYTSDERSALGLIEELGKQTNYNTEEIGKKTNLYGDHKGSWQGIRKPSLIQEGQGAILQQVEKSIHVNILEYINYVDLETQDWSPAIEQLLKENPIGEIFIPIGEYNFSRTILLNDNNSLRIDKGATIKAIKYMEVFIKRHGTLSNLTREYNFFNSIYGEGVIDCNKKANIGISLGGYRHYKVHGLTILDFLRYGIVSKGNDVNYAVELFAKDLYIEIRNNNTNINATGILVNSTDNHFSDIFIVDCLTGIDCPSYSNRFYRIHHWMRDRIKDADLGCISFNDTGSDNTWDTCYADTSNIGFNMNGGSTYINCICFNSPFFRAKNSIGFKLNKKVGRTTLMNCRVFGQTNGDNVAKFIKAFEGEIDETVCLYNCSRGANVDENFPNNPTISTQKVWFDNEIVSSFFSLKNGLLKTTNIELSNKITVPTINFDANHWMQLIDTNTLNLGNITAIKINNRYVPVMTVAPTSSASYGENGMIAYDANNLYLYTMINGTNKWKKIALTDF